ncbi:hypothetical protein ACIRP2_01120 [Streptomyces sp. NPDC101194]|uniref:hypothetical protein n=1 Tax=Streptomyces sp. NPDC101194 TaxID=3366127 RepID=UPI0038022E59
MGRVPGDPLAVGAAGNAGWCGGPDAFFRPPRRTGIGAADALAVEVSNFPAAADSTDFDGRLSAKAGDMPFAIGTGRDGIGP